MFANYNFTGKIMEGKKRGRTDYTAGLPLPNRRLDALARLLTTQAASVAVIIIDGQLHITADDLYANSSRGENKKIRNSIEKIANYFYQLASERVLGFTRAEVFAEICSLHRLEVLSNQLTLVIPDELPAKIADELLNHPDHTQKIYFHLYNYHELSTAAGLAYGEFTQLYRDFKKLETTLRSKTAKQGLASPVDDDLKTFCNAFAQQPAKILEKETQKGIHAEVQLLSHFLQSYQEKDASSTISHYFFGISKLCCLSCRVTFEVANQVFEEQGIPIRLATRGYHDLDFYGWQLPDLLATKDADLNKSSSSAPLARLAYQIGQRALQRIEELRIRQPQSIRDITYVYGAGMTQVTSQSVNTASVNNQEIDAAHKKLTRHRDFLIFMQQQEPHVSLADALKKADLAEQIFLLEPFINLYGEDLDYFNQENLLESFASILESININFKTNSSQEISDANLLQILQNPHLVGEKIATAFKDVQLPSPKKAQSFTSSSAGSQSFSLSSVSDTMPSSLSAAEILTGPLSEPRTPLLQTQPSKKEQGIKRTASKSPRDPSPGIEKNNTKKQKTSPPKNTPSASASSSSLTSQGLAHSLSQVKAKLISNTTTHFTRSSKMKTPIVSAYSASQSHSSNRPSSAATQKPSTNPSSSTPPVTPKKGKKNK